MELRLVNLSRTLLITGPVLTSVSMKEKEKRLENGGQAALDRMTTT